MIHYKKIKYVLNSEAKQLNIVGKSKKNILTKSDNPITPHLIIENPIYH